MAEVRRGDSFIVPIEATNVGDEMAQAVQVEVVLAPADADSEERAELNIDFIPRPATREGWATFKSDPNAGRLSARALGYQKP